MKTLAKTVVRRSYWIISIVGLSTYFMMINSSNQIVYEAGTEIKPVEPFKCIDSVVYAFEVKFKICLKHPDEDLWISNMLLLYREYDKFLVNLVLSGLANYPGSTFIDCGANIGAYTLPALNLGHPVIHPVIVVEPVIRNLGFIKKSLELIKKPYNVRLIPNFISDHHENSIIFHEKKSTNGGTTRMISGSNNLTDKKENQGAQGAPIASVTFQDILDSVESDVAVLKIDVEGHECKALMDFLWTEPKRKYLPYILIEWHQISDLDVQKGLNTCPDFKKFVKGFLNSGYTAHEVEPGWRAKYPRPLTSDQLMEDLHHDLLWVHKDAKSIPELDLSGHNP